VVFFLIGFYPLKTGFFANTIRGIVAEVCDISYSKMCGAQHNETSYKNPFCF